MKTFRHHHCDGVGGLLVLVNHKLPSGRPLAICLKLGMWLRTHEYFVAVTILTQMLPRLPVTNFGGGGEAGKNENPTDFVSQLAHALQLFLCTDEQTSKP